MKFKTENLYLVKICNLIKIVRIDRGVYKKYWEADERYALAYLKDGEYRFCMTFVDIYTHTPYPFIDNVYTTNIPVVIETRPVITNTKYLTKEETLQILKELNPTYLKENTKRLRLFK